MLYHLGVLLQEAGISWARLFTYVSFRVGMSLILAIVLSTVLGSYAIKLLRRHQIGELVRDLGLEGEEKKKGVPTMGGLFIIPSILIPTLLFARLDNIYTLLMILTTLVTGALGFADDYIKVFKKSKDGLAGRYKLVVQIILGLVVGVVVYLSPSTVIQRNATHLSDSGVEAVYHEQEVIKTPTTTIPFFKNNSLDYGKIIPIEGKTGVAIGWAIFVFMTTFVVTMMSNCVNLTDGVDGLAAGTSAIVGATLGVLAYVSSHYVFASYLNIMFIPGAEELVVFASAFVGATMGFLWHNSYPARVFMGDTGSLMLGGIIGVFAVLIHKELLLPILGGIFIIEGSSVILQVISFKYSKKRLKKDLRLFRMAPLHHHFQKADHTKWEYIIHYPSRQVHESRLTVRMFLVGIMLAVLTIITLKLR